MPEGTENGNGKKFGAIVGIVKVLIRPWTNGFLRKEDLTDALREVMTTPQCRRIHSTTEAALDRLSSAAEGSMKIVLKSAEETREVLRLLQLQIHENNKGFDEKIFELHKIKADK